jgi:hypothetical protein
MYRWLSRPIGWYREWILACPPSCGILWREAVRHWKSATGIGSDRCRQYFYSAGNQITENVLIETQFLSLSLSPSLGGEAVLVNSRPAVTANMQTRIHSARSATQRAAWSNWVNGSVNSGLIRESNHKVATLAWRLTCSIATRPATPD